MNSQQAQIQELIQSIDAVLSKASPRLPWVMAGESEQQRQILERTRQYLVSIQNTATPAELPGAAVLGALPADPSLGPAAAYGAERSPGESAQQVLQAVLQEVTYLRTNIMQPMRGEVDDLRLQRDALVKEIKELETQRQQYALPSQVDSQQQQQALAEFLQSLMGRLQENLTVQVAEMLTSLESHALPSATSGVSPSTSLPTSLSGDYTTPLTPQERLAQLQRIQSQSDQLLLKLDTTLRVIFESLQRNIQTYEDSLSQGLDKMHTLGHQGEAIFTALVNRLAQQLGREASQYLQSSLEGTDWQALPGATGHPLVTPSQGATASPLDALMDELTESEATILQAPPDMGLSQSGLEHLNQEIHDLELVSPPSDLDDLDAGEMTMFQMDETLMTTRLQDEDMTIFQINEAIAPFAEVPLDDGPLDNSIDDIDSALELLNQISSELETESEDEAMEPAELESPEGIYDELDALYHSLFGTDVAISEDQEPPVDRHVADAEQAAGAAVADDWETLEQSDPLEAFESQFFEGLPDLSATLEVDEPSAARDLTGEAASPQVVEHLLFDEVPIADAGEAEDTQLLDTMMRGRGQVFPADVITSLEDLITLSDAASLDALRSEGDLVDEDIYIPASPDEDLLSETVVEAPRVELEVDADVLQQLDAELSSLETRESDGIEEEISFLSDLSDEPEDISTSLDLMFPESPATKSPVEEGLQPDMAIIQEDEEAATDDQDSLDLSGLESLATDLAAAPEAPEPDPDPALAGLFDNTAPDTTNASENAPDLMEEVLGEVFGVVPGEEALDLSEDAVNDDLLESLLEEIPPEVFEEENLPPANEGLLDRILEEESAQRPDSPEVEALALADETDFLPDLAAAAEVAPVSESPSAATDLAFDELIELSQSGTESPSLELPENEDWADFGADLPELSDGAPPPPPIPLASSLTLDAETPPLEARPEEVATVGPLDTELPPDRENLTLENFQMVMATPPLIAEEGWLEWPGDENEELTPLATVESSDTDPDVTLLLEPEAATEETLDSLASALEQSETTRPVNPEGATEGLASSLELAAWFEEVEDVPPAIEVTPPGSQLTSLEEASTFLESLTTDSAPAAPGMNDNAFTLEGLGNLFEALPDHEPPPPEEDAFGEDAPSASDPGLGTDFGLAGIDLYDATPPESDTEAAKKKDVGNPPPEDLAVPPEAIPTEAEGAIAPESLDYTSDLILQAIGLQADEEEAGSLASEELDINPPEGEEPDLALVELAADLEDEDDTDPDLAFLLQRLQSAPVEGDTPGDLLSDRLSLLREQEDDLESLIFSVTDILEEDGSFFAPPSRPGADRRSPRSPWYLGIDLGTTGISAVLSNRQTRTLYPLFWLEIKFPGPVHGMMPLPEKTYRLPTAVYVTLAAGSGMGALPEVAIASLNITRQEFSHPTRQPLRDFKPAFRAGIPYYTPDHSHWEPVLQWSDQRSIPLGSLHQALRVLLSSLNYTTPEPREGTETSVLSVGAVGLSDEDLQQALQVLAGIVISHPASWSDTYRFNVREAVLAARLVDDPAQVYLMEESTATLLSALQSADLPIALPDSVTPQPDLFQAPWQGSTLVINGGASVTELALVNLPDRPQSLSHRDFVIRTLAYGGNALDQDIICQLIYPTWVRQAHRTDRNTSIPAQETGPTLNFDDDLDWADPWAALGWEHLTLPIVGDPDRVNRQLLLQRLQGTAVGLGLLEAARYLKLTLQQQDRCTLALGKLSLTMSRQDLGSRVLLPYVQRLNRELNGLLTQTGIPILQVNQVLCSGGSASLGAIARWLRQKLPNATIVQDTYSQPNGPQHNYLSTCSRVAYGLAAAPLYPQVLDQSRHRYSDYFLLMELLRVFPESPVTLDDLLTMLERRGIDTQTCQPAIVALLEGHLPAGLVPTDWEMAMLTPTSQHNPDYKSLLAAPLFVREADQTYRPNPQQWQVYRRYLDTILSATYQKLAEPLDFGFRVMG